MRFFSAILLAMVPMVPVFAADSTAEECAALDARALDVEARLVDYVTVEGRAVLGETSSVWRAYFDGGALVHIIEHQVWDGRGEAHAWYWLEDGRLFRYQERGERRSVSPGDRGATQAVETTLWFGPEGQVIRATQACDGVNVVPIEDEVHATIHHGSLLQTEALTAMRAQRAGERFFCAGNEPFWNTEIIGRRLRYTALAEPAQVFAGQGQYVDGAATLFEWRGRAAGEEQPIVVWVREETCTDSMADLTFPLRGAVRMPGGTEKRQGCCDTAPPLGVLARLDAPRQVHYRCDEGELDVWFLRRGAVVALRVDDTVYALPQAPSDPARYSGMGLTFLAGGNDASVDHDGLRIFSACRSDGQ